MALSEPKITCLLSVPLHIGMVITQEKSGEAADPSELANSPAMYSHWLLQILLVPLKIPQCPSLLWKSKILV